MKELIRTTSLAQAQIIQVQLRDHAIHAEIQGENNPLGLPSSVRVLVADADLQRAKTIIESSAQETSESNTSTSDYGKEMKSVSYAKRWGVAVICATFLFVGYTAFEHHWSDREFAVREAIDYNEDGQPDEKLSILGHDLLTLYRDYNYDSEMDQITSFDLVGRITDIIIDADFDGRFDTKELYRKGVRYRRQIDTNGDDKADLITIYRQGRPVERVFFKQGHAKRHEYLDKWGRRQRAEVDTNGDNKFDTLEHFDQFGTIIKTEPLRIK